MKLQDIFEAALENYEMNCDKKQVRLDAQYFKDYAENAYEIPKYLKDNQAERFAKMAKKIILI